MLSIPGGTHVYLWLIHVGVWQKKSQYCKSIILQLKYIIFKIFFYLLFLIIIIFLTLQYCIGFAIHQHASAMVVHVFPILNP